MSDVTLIGLDVAKAVFQVHGVDADGTRVLSRRLRRAQVSAFFARQPRCVIAMEACAGSHHWGRAFQDLGHQVRLLPAREVKPFVRLPKTDVSDAAAIAEAARRPELRSVPVKSETEQAECSAHAARDLLVRERTALINALRAHLAEFGIVAPAGDAGRTTLFEQVRGERLDDLPELLRLAAQGLVEAIEALERSIAAIEDGLAAAAKADATVQRLQAVPGIGWLTASALVAFAGDARRFKSARHFVAWLGLAPRVEASGTRTRIGGITKSGPEYLRRLLVHGARSLLRVKPSARDPWFNRLLARRPAAVAITALAAKQARVAWAIMARDEAYRPRLAKAA
jgi:transposase